MTLDLISWAGLAAYMVHLLDDGFVHRVSTNFWPGYNDTMFFWFNAAAVALIAAGNLAFDLAGGHLIILPGFWIFLFALHGVTVHVSWTVRRRDYSPGLVTSVLYWIVAYVAARYAYAAGLISALDFWTGLATGIVLLDRPGDRHRIWTASSRSDPRCSSPGSPGRAALGSTSGPEPPWRQMWRTAVWQQSRAAIDVLEDAVRDCPDELWTADLWEEPGTPGFSAFWYLAYHALFWLDLYLSETREGFSPPAPFGLEELDPAGKLPPRAFSRGELQRYLAHGRRKCRETIMSLTDAQLVLPGTRAEMPFAELLLYNLRHVQEHAAQLNTFLGQRAGLAAGWIPRAKDGSR